MSCGFVEVLPTSAPNCSLQMNYSSSKGSLAADLHFGDP